MPTALEIPDFRPLVRSAHLQTLALLAPRRGLERRLRGELLAIRVDEDSEILVACDWQHDPARAPTLVLVHGMCGCARSQYLLGTAALAHRRGFNVLRLNVRGSGDTEHLSATPYMGGLTIDLHAVCHELVVEYGLAPPVVAGWSLGGNMALKLAGELAAGANSLLSGLVAVCPAIDLEAAAVRIDSPGIEVAGYRRFFLAQLKATIRRRAELTPDRFDAAKLDAITTMRGFDDLITARYWGYPSAEAYYEDASALRVLADIEVPTLVIAARDDPLVPFASFSSTALESNPALRLVAPDSGGHCAFLQRRSSADSTRWWAEHRVVDFAELVTKLR